MESLPIEILIMITDHLSFRNLVMFSFVSSRIYLIMRKFNPRMIQEEINRMLFIYSEEGHVDVVKQLLLKFNANVSAHGDESLILASEEGHVDVVKLLLEHGAKHHDRAFHGACYFNHIEVVKILLKVGANVHYSDDAALITSCENNRIEMIRILLQYGASRMQEITKHIELLN